ncbi:lactococcin 972 family bacteriocin [Plantibacter sp. Mn2098]|uniref:lactococcin 972 family bacteriocin n=1 Tax=Plantibacter sp. Mn2098 TaxID=3395266 RepID=UPI003BE74E86
MSMKRALATIGLIGLLSSGAVAAYADTQYPVEGGQWNYGLAGGVHAYSDYLVDRCHGTTVENDWGVNRSIDTAANKWSNASHAATPLTNNHYYYRVC